MSIISSKLREVEYALPLKLAAKKQAAELNSANLNNNNSYSIYNLEFLEAQALSTIWINVLSHQLETKKREIEALPFMPKYLDMIPSVIPAADASAEDIDDFLGNPEHASFLNKIKELNLNDLELEILPRNIEKLTELQILRLENNQLTKLPDTIGNLVSLKKLFLGHNQLTELPDTIGHLRYLSKLDLPYNHFVKLPATIGKLTYLKRLAIEGNPLISLQIELINLRILQKLDCNFERLTKIDPQILKMSVFNIYRKEQKVATKISQNAPFDRVNTSHIHPNSMSDLLDQLLEQFDGLAIGEIHTHEAPKRFLVQNMGYLAHKGVNKIFLESFLKEDQEYLDDFFETGELDDGFKEDIIEQIMANTGNTREQVLQNPNNLLGILEQARKYGIRIIGIDSEESIMVGKEPKRAASREYWESRRTQRMNYCAFKVIQKIQNHRPGKFIALMGYGHLHGVAKMPGAAEKIMPGVAEMVKVPSVVIFDEERKKDLLNINYVSGIQNDCEDFDTQYKILYNFVFSDKEF